MPNITGLRCKECNEKYPVKPLFVCDFCFGPLEVSYDYEAVSRAISRESIEAGPHTLWRYAELLPASAEHAVDIGAGFTPLVKARNLGDALGLDNLWIKNDTANPTHSFKDRVVSVATTKAVEFGFATLACASTGNLAGSTGAHGRRANLETMVFVPHDLERAKINMAAIFGSVVLVRGSYDDANRLCTELADRNPWAFVNINMRPYYSEGSKTLGYEVAEQLGWRAPRHVIVPVASGSLHTKVWKGLREFTELGLIEDAPTSMHVAQADGCSPIARAIRDGQTHPRPVRPDTVAKSLAIGNPADGYYATKVANETGGKGCVVPEWEVAEGIRLLAESEGIFAETAGGVVISALKQLAESGAISRDEETVALITGSGLKTLDAVEETLNPSTIDASLDSFDAMFA